MTKKRSIRDRKITLMRSAQTAATAKMGIGGRPKRRPPRAVTLPKLKCLEERS